jgi:hypothetical protein
VAHSLPFSMHSSIPRVRCPKCATDMRLAEIVPDMNDRDVIKFDCNCGFTYAMSSIVREEEQLQRIEAA